LVFFYGLAWLAMPALFTDVDEAEVLTTASSSGTPWRLSTDAA
jgi:hypothetical protein